MNNFNKFVLLIFITPCIGFNEFQNVFINFYENECHNDTLIYNDIINIPVKCNCFTTNKKCITQINNKINLAEYNQIIKKIFKENNYHIIKNLENNCLPLKNNTYFTYQYLLSNQYCSRDRLIFSIIFILCLFLIMFAFYFSYKRNKYIYQRLNELNNSEELDNLFEAI